MKQFFCWMIAKAFGTLGMLGFMMFGFAGEWYSVAPTAVVIAYCVALLAAFRTAKFTADNYEDYFVGYWGWMVSRVSFFQTKVGYVVRTFFASLLTYTFVADVIFLMLYDVPK